MKNLTTCYTYNMKVITIIQERSYNNIDNFRWIRGQKGDKNFILDAKNAYFKGEIFNNLNINVNLTNKNLSIDYLNVEHDAGNYYGKSKLDISGIKPHLYIDLKFLKLSPEFFKLFLLEEKELEKQIKAQNHKLDTSTLNFYGISNFDTTFNLAVDNLSLPNLKLENLLINGTSNEGNFNFTNINADIFKGKVTANGHLSTIRPIYNLNLGIGFTNIDPSMLTNYLVNYSNNSGYLSSSGTLETKGLNQKDFVENLQGNFKILAKNVCHNGFSIEELMEIPSFSTSYDDKMKRIKYYTNYGETKFDEISGYLIINNGTAILDNLKVQNKLFSGASNIAYNFLNDELKASSKFSFLLKKGEKPLVIDFSNSGKINNQTSTVNYQDLDSYIRNKENNNNNNNVN